MFKNTKKNTDIFSYIPASQLSLTELENIFYRSIKGLNEGPFEVFYSQKDVTLNSMQLHASNELNTSKKSVAYIVRDHDVIALIGYLE